MTQVTPYAPHSRYPTAHSPRRVERFHVLHSYVLRFTFYAPFLILGSLLIGCSLLAESPPAEPPTPTAMALPPTIALAPETAPTIPDIEDTGAEVATVVPEIELSETYRNTTAGYAFDYPAGWLVDGEGEYVSLQNYRSEELPPREVNDPDLYKIEFVWIRPGQARTVDEMLDQMRDGLAGSPEEITLNDFTGLRLEMGGFRGDVSDVLLFDVNGRVLLIQSWQGGRLFDRVTGTLRPLNANSP
ncbi:MAG: hypothetical protein MAG451_00245 [Anaerolineales bacterium]|nr:hypothetical protein [Anaerolineales bacterium]